MMIRKSLFVCVVALVLTACNSDSKSKNLDSYTVFLAQNTGDDLHSPLRLYLSDDQGEAVQLSHLTNEDIVLDYAISPNGDFVVYRTVTNVFGRDALYKVMVNKPGIAEKITPNLAEGENYFIFPGIKISEDNQKVAFQARQTASLPYQVYVVDLQNLGSPKRIDREAGDEQSFALKQFEFSEDSQHLYYTNDQDRSRVIELYRAALDDPSDFIKINPTYNFREQGIESIFSRSLFAHSIQEVAAGSSVLYIARDEKLIPELYKVDIDNPGLAIRISGNHDDGDGVYSFVVSPNGEDVYYQVQGPDDLRLVYHVDLNFPGVIQLVAPAFSSVRGVEDFSFDANFEKFAYTSSRVRSLGSEDVLWAQSVSGIVEAISVTGASLGYEIGTYGIAFLPDGSGIVGNGFSTEENEPSLYYVPFEQGEAGLKIIADANFRDEYFYISADSQKVSYLKRVEDGTGDRTAIQLRRQSLENDTKSFENLSPGSNVFVAPTFFTTFPAGVSSVPTFSAD